MPNWIEGTMKLRGKMSDIKRFIDEGICRYELTGDITQLSTSKRPKSDYIKDSSYDEDELDYEIFNDPYVEGTRRMFVLDSHILMDKPEGICCFNIRQAWSFTAYDTDEENLIALADKYNVDIRLFGIECGMEFIQEVIVHHGHDSEKGKIVLNNCIQFEDWDWECPFPSMGG